MAEKDAFERRVYNLPTDLLERLRAFMTSQSITSEAEAARRLLDAALQMRDDVYGILKTLQSKYAEEKDLRVLAGDVLAKHVLVTSVSISDSDIEFTIRNGHKGRLINSGHMQVSGNFQEDGEWSNWPPTTEKPKVLAPKWEPSKTSGDLDDDIPF